MPITITPRRELDRRRTAAGSPSFVHRAAKTPDRMMMNTGLIDCTHDTGISQPKMFRSSRLSE